MICPEWRSEVHPGPVFPVIDDIAIDIKSNYRIYFDYDIEHNHQSCNNFEHYMNSHIFYLK